MVGLQNHVAMKYFLFQERVNLYAYFLSRNPLLDTKKIEQRCLQVTARSKQLFDIYLAR